MARDLIARGIPPGPELGRLLRRCRELEDRAEGPDRDAILDRCLAERRRLRSDRDEDGAP